MRTVAWVGAVVVLAGLIVMAVAGITGATAVLVTAVALAGMIALGSMMGGRHTPDVAPVATRPDGRGGSGSGPGSGEGADDGGTEGDVAGGGAHDADALDPAADGAEGADGGTTTR
ncbi:MAG TPA: hypothetical protein VN796_06560 [Acidimicrobiales bacterium]|nr:hypothetical protein [Acidimicrobiales bacterium]